MPGRCQVDFFTQIEVVKKKGKPEKTNHSLVKVEL